MKPEQRPEQVEAAVKGLTVILATIFMFGGIVVFGSLLLVGWNTGWIALYGVIYFAINAACARFGYAYADKLANGIRQQIEDMPVS